VVWVCEVRFVDRGTPKQKLFSVVPACSIGERCDLYARAEALIEAGLWIRLSFREFNKYHVPIRPIPGPMRGIGL
jgi:hypothetical protein